MNKMKTEFQDLSENYSKSILLPYIHSFFPECREKTFELMDYTKNFCGFFYHVQNSEYIISFDFFIQNYEDEFYYSNCGLRISRKKSEYVHYYDIFRDKVYFKDLNQNQFFKRFDEQLKKHQEKIEKRKENDYDWWFNPDYENRLVPYDSTTSLTRYLKILIEGEIHFSKKSNQIIVIENYHEPEGDLQWISIALYLPTLNNWFIFSHIYWIHLTDSEHFYLKQIHFLQNKYNFELRELIGEYDYVFPYIYDNKESDSSQQRSYSEELAEKILNNEIEKYYLDYKAIWIPKNPKHRSELVKDVIGLLNASNYHKKGDRKAYLIIGISEKNGTPAFIKGLTNSQEVKRSIESIIREYISPIPDVNTYLYDIKQIRDKIIPRLKNFDQFTIPEKNIEENVIFIIELCGLSKKVYETSRNMTFSAPNNKYNRDIHDSWIRFGEHTKKISENERKQIRES
jgi:hypothetical protein